MILHGQDEPKRRGLSAHLHSGKVLAHHHTSYPALAFLVLLATILTAGVTATSQAADSTLSLTVLGPPPTTGATIDEPLDGQTFTVPTQTVRGTCPLNLMVEIYRNGVFAGSTMCDAGGLYNLLITLVPGQNDLVARVLDGLNQYGPDSATVTVYYNPPPPTPTPTPSPTPAPTATPTPPGSPVTPKPKATPKPKPAPAPAPAEPFWIESGAHFYQGAGPEDPVTWNVRIHGGNQPFTVVWQWGDGKKDTIEGTTAELQTGTHRYDKPGVYKTLIRVTDASGREAVITLVSIINGAPPATARSEASGFLIWIWPALVLVSLALLSFWLGERHKQRTLEPQVPQLTT